MARQVVVLALIFIAIAGLVSSKEAAPTSSPSPMPSSSPAASSKSSQKAATAPTSGPKAPVLKASSSSQSTASTAGTLAPYADTDVSSPPTPGSEYFSDVPAREPEPIIETEQAGPEPVPSTPVVMPTSEASHGLGFSSVAAAGFAAVAGIFAF